MDRNLQRFLELFQLADRGPQYCHWTTLKSGAGPQYGLFVLTQKWKTTTSSILVYLRSKMETHKKFELHDRSMNTMRSIRRVFILNKGGPNVHSDWFMLNNDAKHSLLDSSCSMTEKNRNDVHLDYSSPVTEDHNKVHWTVQSVPLDCVSTMYHVFRWYKSLTLPPSISLIQRDI